LNDLVVVSVEFVLISSVLEVVKSSTLNFAIEILIVFQLEKGLHPVYLVLVLIEETNSASHILVLVAFGGDSTATLDDVASGMELRGVLHGSWHGHITLEGASGEIFENTNAFLVLVVEQGHVESRAVHYDSLAANSGKCKC
jgi:hypothetical protein